MGQAELPQPTMEAPGEAAARDWCAATAEGDFPAAWRASDRVLALRAGLGRDDPAQPYHLRWVWDGTAPDGADVLVRCYHGLGDTLQFCRFLPALRRRAARVTLEAQAELLPLLERLGAVDEIAAFDPARPLPPRACDVEIMELSHALRIAPEPVPYLPVARRPEGGGLRAGLCWRANASWRPERSMPEAAFGALLDVPGVRFASLQKGDAPGDMTPCPAAVADTAALIAGLDLVITVDTMVAHLAGAIGVPVWLLLDSEPDWRWWAGGRGSPWYRGIRKYRQQRPGDWDAPLEAVRADLTRCARAGTLQV